jgi:hypothetical protein
MRRPGIYRKAEAGGAQRGVEGRACDAGLHHGQKILGLNTQHLVHAQEVEADGGNLGICRDQGAFQAGAGAEGNQRDLVRSAPCHDGLHIFEPLRIGDGERRAHLGKGHVPAVALQDRRAGRQVVRTQLSA